MIEELPFFTDEADTGPSVKDQFVGRADQKVNKDYFLYSCWEEEVTQQAMEDTYQKSLRWPPLHGAETAEPFVPESEGKAQLEALFQWYQQTHPLLSEAAPLIYEKLPYFMAPFAYLLSDLKMYMAARYPAQRGVPDAGQLEDLVALLVTYFPYHAANMGAYMVWSLQKPAKESYDLASFPPVGRYAKILRKFQGRSQGSSSYSSDSRGPHSGGRSSYAGSSSGPQREKRDRRPPRQHSPADEAAAEIGLKEVEQALTSLASDLAQTEIALAPQNSFVRRLQHQRVMDRGFTSHSQGDGDQRTVVIDQKK